MRWSIVSLLVLQNLHLGRIWRIPLGRILAWTFLVKRLWSCAAAINLSVSTLSPALLSYWWMSCMSTSAFWLWSGCWLCNDFEFQAVFPFSPFSLAISINFRAFSVFFIFTSNLLSRSTSISRANSIASFTTECEPYSFLSFKASCSIQSSDKFKYRKRPIIDFL